MANLTITNNQFVKRSLYFIRERLSTYIKFQTAKSSFMFSGCHSRCHHVWLKTSGSRFPSRCRATSALRQNKQKDKKLWAHIHPKGPRFNSIFIWQISSDRQQQQHTHHSHNLHSRGGIHKSERTADSSDGPRLTLLRGGTVFFNHSE